MKIQTIALLLAMGLSGCGSGAIVSEPKLLPQWLCAGQSNIEDGRFAWTFGEASRAAGHPVALFNATRGGTMIEGWLPNGREWNDRILPYIAQKIDGVLWWQGESDALDGTGEAQKAYQGRLESFITEIRAQFGPVPFIIIKLQRYDASLTASQIGEPGAVFTEPDYWTAVRQAQIVVAEKLLNVLTVETEDITNGEVHPTYAYAEIGKRAAQVAYKIK